MRAGFDPFVSLSEDCQCFAARHVDDLPSRPTQMERPRARGRARRQQNTMPQILLRGRRVVVLCLVGLDSGVGREFVVQYDLGDPGEAVVDDLAVEVRRAAAAAVYKFEHWRGAIRTVVGALVQDAAEFPI